MDKEKRKRIKRDNVFKTAASIILLLGIPTLILESYLPGGDWKGVTSFLIFILIILPMLLFIFIPWNIWFLIQYIKFRNRAFENNSKPLWISALVLTYMIFHYGILILQELYK
jgi:hypothetical protein